MASAKPTLLYRFYVALAGAIAPFAFRKVAKKLRAHDVPEARIRERIGYATVARPMGQLVWFHAASVGESLSVLALINAMIRIDPKLNVLITSGTATVATATATATR